MKNNNNNKIINKNNNKNKKMYGLPLSVVKLKHLIRGKSHPNHFFILLLISINRHSFLCLIWLLYRAAKLSLISINRHSFLVSYGYYTGQPNCHSFL